MLTINESVKIENCKSNIPGVRIDMINTSAGSMRGVIFRSESDSIINGITKLVKSTFEDESETYYEALENTLDSDSAVSDIFNGAAVEAKKRHDMACNGIYVQITQDKKDDQHCEIIDISSKDTRTIINLIKAAKKWDWNYYPGESYDIFMWESYDISMWGFNKIAPDIHYHIYTDWGHDDATHHIEFRLTGPRKVKEMIDFLRNIYGDIPIHKPDSE